MTRSASRNPESSPREHLLSWLSKTMVYLIVFVEAARALRDVATVGSNDPFVALQCKGHQVRTHTGSDAKDPGAPAQCWGDGTEDDATLWHARAVMQCSRSLTCVLGGCVGGRV